MIGLIQRTNEAAVDIAGERVAEIGRGILALIGIEKEDSEQQADRLLEKMLAYRIFPDADGKMNLGLKETGAGLLLVPQFTLAAETRKGLRPGFSSAASPENGRQLFDYFAENARIRLAEREFGCGVFGADMQVSLVNDGPVTFWLQV